MGTSHLPNKPITDKEKKVILPRQKQPNYELRAAVKTMKLFFAIFVLLALFTEGKGNGGVRQANHKNHALNMRQLLNAAVLRKDEALADFTGTVTVKYKAPVVVDLTKLQEMLEQHFDRIKNHFDTVENHFDTVEANVTANSERFFSFKRKTRTEIESLRASLEGLSQCQVGEYSSGYGYGFNTWKTINFQRNFKQTPKVVASVKGLNVRGGNEGLDVQVRSATTTKFQLNLKAYNEKPHWIAAIWIACA